MASTFSEPSIASHPSSTHLQQPASAIITTHTFISTSNRATYTTDIYLLFAIERLCVLLNNSSRICIAKKGINKGEKIFNLIVNCLEYETVND
jgi:hypothetical protein